MSETAYSTVDVALFWSDGWEKAYRSRANFWGKLPLPAYHKMRKALDRMNEAELRYRCARSADGSRT